MKFIKSTGKPQDNNLQDEIARLRAVEAECARLEAEIARVRDENDRRLQENGRMALAERVLNTLLSPFIRLL